MSAHVPVRAPHVQHHFANSDQQFDSAKMGMWVFLYTEIAFFGGLFVAYIIYRSWNPDLFTMAATQLDTILGATNTLVLIASSLTIALAIRAIQTDHKQRAIYLLLSTVVLAGVFMVIKAFEYGEKFAKGIFPGSYYTYEGIAHDSANVFFSIYYMMTGLHALHVIIGIGIILWVAWKVHKNRFSSEYYTPVEITGLYWHLVDIIWIFLFPLLYLIE
jgi:cytochrome c oxidase subunit III